MLPFIRHGDILTVVTSKSNQLCVGDVIVYRSHGEELLAHRLVSKKKENDQIRLMTRGDATFAHKETIRQEQVLGRVVSIQRKDKVFNLSDPCQRIMALLWITAAPVTTFTLFLARKFKVMVS